MSLPPMLSRPFFGDDQLRRLNSATQYPSILTYHAIGERGILTADRTTTFDDIDPDLVEVTEKVDGVNARIVIPPCPTYHAFIGSRTELLTYTSDLVSNGSQGIVDTVRTTAGVAVKGLQEDNDWVVLYGEVYGGRAGSAAKNYTTDPTRTGFRLFDLALIPGHVLDWPVERIAAWRDHGGQHFVSTDVLAQAAQDIAADLVPLAVTAGPPPATVADTAHWLREVMPSSHARLDPSGRGDSEGVIVRTADRSRIAKIRHQDYRRTLRATT